MFDALTSSRPYKPAWSIDDALAWIRDESGRHFDPEVVAALDAVLPTMLEIKARYGEIRDGTASGQGEESRGPLA